MLPFAVRYQQRFLENAWWQSRQGLRRRKGNSWRQWTSRLASRTTILRRTRDSPELSSQSDTMSNLSTKVAPETWTWHQWRGGPPPRVLNIGKPRVCSAWHVNHTRQSSWTHDTWYFDSQYFDQVDNHSELTEFTIPITYVYDIDISNISNPNIKVINVYC